MSNTIFISMSRWFVEYDDDFPILISENGTLLKTKCVVLTTGTFLNGLMFNGMKVKPGGRINSISSIGLADTLKRLGFKTGRMKTGTPPRIEKQSVDFSNLYCQPGDDVPTPFSFMNDAVWLNVNKTNHRPVPLKVK